MIWWRSFRGCSFGSPGNVDPDLVYAYRLLAKDEPSRLGWGTVMASVGVIAVDGTKVMANASRNENLDYEQITRAIVEEAIATDAAEDEKFGEARGDELPEELRTPGGRRAWLRQAKSRLEAERDADPQPVPRDRPKRLKEAKRRLDEELWSETRANEAYERYRARGRMKDGRRFGRPPDPVAMPDTPQGKVNLSDPDSRNVKASRGWVQGYNAQAATNTKHIVIAAEVNADSPDFGHLQPMVDATQRELTAIGINDAPSVLLADAGYWHQEQMESIVADGTQVLIAPDASKRKAPRRGWTAAPTRSCVTSWPARPATRSTASASR